LLLESRRSEKLRGHVETFEFAEFTDEIRHFDLAQLGVGQRARPENQGVLRVDKERYGAAVRARQVHRIGRPPKAMAPFTTIFENASSYCNGPKNSDWRREAAVRQRF